MRDKFLVIDGSSLIHRAFFALPPLTNKKGVPTGAVFGLCKMLLKLLEEVQPQYMAVAFDKSRKTFRTEMFADYKGQRKPTPPELKSQFPLAIEVLGTMDIAALELDNYEADDIIGTFAAHAPEDIDVVVVTGDKDALQLVDKRTKVYYTRKGITDIQIFDEEEFSRVYEGLVPLQLIDLKGLMGDTSDNIPGVPGVGPKTAIKLIKEYGNVETVLENIDKVAGKSLKTKLEENKASALLSKQLATIFKETPVSLDMAAYELKPLREEAKGMLQELDFKNMYDSFAAVLGGQEELSLFAIAEEEPTEIKLLTSEADSEELFNRINAAKELTSFVVKIEGQLPKLSLREAKVFFDNKIYELSQELIAGKAFQQWLQDEKAPKATIDTKELYKWALGNEIKLAGLTEDVALAAYVVDPSVNISNLQAISQYYLENSNAMGCEAVAQLVPILREKLVERQQEKLYRELELPLAKVLAAMEFNGIQPDLTLLDQLNEDMTFRIAKLEKLAEEQAGEKVNLKSPKQLGVLLFEKLGLPAGKKTKTGYSTDVKVLEELQGKHPIIETILEYRKLTKLQSTYLEGLKPLVNNNTGRIHTHFQQTVTVTGRLSSTDPNLQNIPTRTEEGKHIREIFVPGEGYDCLMSCDYSQVELRILACIALDELLLEAFRENQDIHARTAAEVFGVPLAEVTKEMRSRAKAVNFGIVYGISDFGLAAQLKVSRGEAAGYIKSYFARYTGVKKYMADMVELARNQGYVSTMMGRRRYLPDIRHSNFNLRSFAERTAINTPIQGTAADVMKKAMLDVQQAIEASGLKSRILLQVHDELVLEVVEAEKEQIAELVKTTMEKAVQLDIPLEAEVSFGSNWAQAK